MSVDELAKIVRQMYDEPAGSRKTRMNQAQKPIMANLFGILYAREIEACGEAPTMTARVIAQKAGIGAAEGRSYGKEIDRGRLLAEYVRTVIDITLPTTFTTVPLACSSCARHVAR